MPASLVDWESPLPLALQETCLLPPSNRGLPRPPAPAVTTKRAPALVVVAPQPRSASSLRISFANRIAPFVRAADYSLSGSRPSGATPPKYSGEAFNAAGDERPVRLRSRAARVWPQSFGMLANDLTTRRGQSGSDFKGGRPDFCRCRCAATLRR